MNLWQCLFGDTTTQEAASTTPDLGVNPANGLPMLEGTWIDIEGNTYGTDNHNSWDAFDTCGSEFDWNNQ